MKFKRLAEYFEKIEKEASRLAMTEELADLFKESSVNEIDLVVYLSLGNLRPKFEKVEFNLAEKMMLRVLGVAYGVEIGRVEKAFKQIGDLGEVIDSLGAKVEKDKGLSVGEVYKRLMDIARSCD